jgi:MCRA family
MWSMAASADWQPPRISSATRGCPAKISPSMRRMTGWGALSLAGDAATGYILPTGAVFDAEFRCTFDLLATIPSVGDPAISVKDDFFAFKERYPHHDRAHIIGRDGRILHGRRFGLSTRDRLDLVRLALTPVAKLDWRPGRLLRHRVLAALPGLSVISHVPPQRAISMRPLRPRGVTFPGGSNLRRAARISAIPTCSSVRPVRTTRSE